MFIASPELILKPCNIPNLFFWSIEKVLEGVFPNFGEILLFVINLRVRIDVRSHVIIYPFIYSSLDKMNDSIMLLFVPITLACL